MARTARCPDQMTHQCKPCQTWHRSAADLRRHEASKKHKDAVGEVVEKPHKCQTCGRAFVQSAHLAAHMATHQPATMRCRLCGRTVKTQSGLTHHMNAHHREEHTVDNSPPQQQRALPAFEVPQVNNEVDNPPALTPPGHADPSSPSMEQMTPPMVDGGDEEFFRLKRMRAKAYIFNSMQPDNAVYMDPDEQLRQALLEYLGYEEPQGPPMSYIDPSLLTLDGNGSLQDQTYDQQMFG